MKLTARMRETLVGLEGCTAPWNAQHPVNKENLAKLHLMGFASWIDGGWIITEAGRTAISQNRGTE